MNRLLVVFISGQMWLWAAIPLGVCGLGSPKGSLWDGFRESRPAFTDAAPIDHPGLVGSRDEEGGLWLLAWISPSEMFPAGRHPFLAAYRDASGLKAFVSALMYTQTTSTRL